MKTLVVALTLTLSSLAYAKCGSETVDFGSCGAQIYANGGAAVGSTQIAMDPLGRGDARLVCTKEGWKYTDATCDAGFKVQCIKDRLNAYNSSIYYDLSEDEVISMLASDSTDGRRSAVVDMSNTCDKDQ